MRQKIFYVYKEKAKKVLNLFTLKRDDTPYTKVEYMQFIYIHFLEQKENVKFILCHFSFFLNIRKKNLKRLKSTNNENILRIFKKKTEKF